MMKYFIIGFVMSLFQLCRLCRFE